MEKITSKDNKQLKDFIKLSTSKNYRTEKSMFAIDGVKLIIEALENHIEIEIVFVTASCMFKKSQELEKLFQLANCVEITDEIANKMSIQKSPQGIFAICKSNLQTFELSDINKKAVMLVDLQDAGNVGTIIRTAEAVGINNVILTKNTCDLLNPKVIRASMGSIFRIKSLIVDDHINTIEKLSNLEIETIASVVDSSAEDVLTVDFSKPLVLLIGNEGNGLDKKTINSCHKSITIKMKGNAESLNASMAACILMWEINK